MGLMTSLLSMKKLVLPVIAIAAMFASCGGKGEKAETSDAAAVETIQTDATVTYETIKEGSSMSWKASHLGGVQERFGKIFFNKATFSVTDGALTNAKVSVDMSSLTVENFPEGDEKIGKLTSHLLGQDFFKTEMYPNSTFELTGIEAIEGEFNSKVTGNLTMLDSTKSITFKANVTLKEDAVAIVSENFSVDRTNWGLSYHLEGSEGVPVDYLIDNEIGFKIDLTATK